MQGNAGSNPDDHSLFGLSYLFFRMAPDFRQELVRETLLWRDQATLEARTALRQAIGDSVTVEGFRNAGLAPAAMLFDPVTDLVGVRSDLASAVLRMWIDSQEPLRARVAGHLKSRSIATQEFDFASNQISMGSSNAALIEARDSFLEAHPEVRREELTLMMDLTTGSIAPYENKSFRDDDSLEGMFTRILSKIGSLPPAAAEWDDAVLHFREGLNSLVESKSLQRQLLTKLDDSFAEIRESYPDLIEFFQWDDGRWASANLAPTGELQPALDMVDELQGLLSRYAPIHERAPAAAEELERAGIRMELLPHILECGQSLDRLMESKGKEGFYDGEFRSNGPSQPPQVAVSTTASQPVKKAVSSRR